MVASTSSFNIAFLGSPLEPAGPTASGIQRTCTSTRRRPATALHISLGVFPFSAGSGMSSHCHISFSIISSLFRATSGLALCGWVGNASSSGPS